MDDLPRVTRALATPETETVLVEVTDDIAPGVVWMPHGGGHDLPGARMAVAREHAGVNVDLLTDDLRIDPLSGTAVLNGTRAQVVPA